MSTKSNSPSDKQRLGNTRVHERPNEHNKSRNYEGRQDGGNHNRTGFNKNSAGGNYAAERGTNQRGGLRGS